MYSEKLCVLRTTKTVQVEALSWLPFHAVLTRDSTFLKVKKAFSHVFCGLPLCSFTSVKVHVDCATFPH